MTRKNKVPDPSGYVILLVDDSLEYRESACSLLEREGHTVLTAENGRDRYTFDAGAILFISAQGNYVEVTEKTDKLRTVLLRSSLRRIENQLGDCPSLVRCHRAYIINTKKIRKAAGNAQGLSLILGDTDKKIPVARAYARPFKQRLTRL